MSQNIENITFSKEIGTRIGLLRASNNNETQQSLADAMGVSREIIQHWESGKRHIKADAIIKLSQHFNVSADYLLGVYDEKEPKQDIRAIHEYTGLSPEIIRLLNEIKVTPMDPEFLRGLSNHLSLLENEDVVIARLQEIGRVAQQWIIIAALCEKAEETARYYR